MNNPNGIDTDSRPSSVWPWIAVVWLTVLAVWRWFAAPPPYGGDWGQYLSHARAMLEGRSYGDIGYLFSQLDWTVGPPTYPPGVSTTLVPVLAVFGESTVAPLLVMHMLLAVFLLAMYGYLSRHGDSTLAAAAVVLTGTSFLLDDAANVVGSDIGMCAFVWVVLFLGLDEGGWSWRRALFIGLAGAIALTYRVAAVPILAALGLWALLRGRKAGWAPWLIVAIWAAVFAWVLVEFSGVADVSESVALEFDDPVEEGGGGAVAWFMDRIEGKILRYRFTFTEAFLYAFPIRRVNQAYHAAALLLSALGMALWLRRGWNRLGVFFILATAAMLLAAPVWDPRYGWVLVPWITYGLVKGIAAVWNRWAERGRADPTARAPGNGMTVAFVFVLVISVMASARLLLGPPRVGVAESEWLSVAPSIVEDGSAAEPVLMSNRPRVSTWYTRFPAAGIPGDGFEVLESEIDRMGVTHAVLNVLANDRLLVDFWESWAALPNSRARLIHETAHLRVYAVDPGPSG